MNICQELQKTPINVIGISSNVINMPINVKKALNDNDLFDARELLTSYDCTGRIKIIVKNSVFDKCSRERSSIFIYI